LDLQFKDKLTCERFLRGFQLLIFRALVENASECYWNRFVFLEFNYLRAAFTGEAKKA
jgi:hypothetical protein